MKRGERKKPTVVEESNPNQDIHLSLSEISSGEEYFDEKWKNVQLPEVAVQQLKRTEKALDGTALLIDLLYRDQFHKEDAALNGTNYTPLDVRDTSRMHTALRFLAEEASKAVQDIHLTYESLEK